MYVLCVYIYTHILVIYTHQFSFLEIQTNRAFLFFNLTCFLISAFHLVTLCTISLSTWYARQCLSILVSENFNCK